MDPNANLQESLTIAKRIIRNVAPKRFPTAAAEDDALALAERLVALDQWLRSGGVLPKPWHDVAVAKVLT